jgi:FkbM family methyltransferase
MHADPTPEQEWRPGLVGRSRALVRRSIRSLLGERGERWIHGAYHRLLRATGRFGLPEDAVTVAMLGAIAARSATIIDVGANVGRYAWFLRRHAPAQARLFALEPHPGAADLLRGAIGEMAGCTVLELGASDIDGTAALMVPSGAFGSALSGLAWVRPDEEVNDRDGPSIRVRRLDGLVEDGTMKVRSPLFLKIDVEGGEARVIRGAAALLRAEHPIVYFECQASSLARQGETPDGVWADLRHVGYRMYADRSGRFEPVSAADPTVVNYLAIPGLPVDAVFDASSMAGILDDWAARTSDGAAAS